MSTVTGTYTVNDIVIAALRKSGIVGLGQTPNGSDMLDAQDDLADMWAQWNSKTWLVWDKVQIVGPTSTGQITPYTVGPGGQYNVTPRPDRVEAAFVRILNVPNGIPVDQPLRAMASAEDYSNVALKELVAFPKAYYYDPASPVGNLNIYPWPQGGQYAIGITIKNSFPLTLPLNLSVANLSPVAMAASKFCLARRLRQGYGKGLRPDPELNALAKDALSTMRAAQVMVPELKMPAQLLTRGWGYNVYGDTFS